MSNICFQTATELARGIRERRWSAREVMEAHLAQIERLNPQVNAIVTLHADEALDGARAADALQARGEPLGPLHGLPVAHKDLVPTKGMLTTFGSPIYKDFIPDHDALIVSRLKEAGAITIGKTNTPEFGAGSQTFNPVFGATLNPYDLSTTCGGSSGGAAVAVACGMLPIADGSDTGGSLRNPANFCNVVGFRTSPGRVPAWPRTVGWFPIPVQGPIARTVEDAALLLSAMAGPDLRSPIALADPGETFFPPPERDVRGLRIAFTRDFGELPVDPRVAAVLEQGRANFEQLGCEVTDDTPDFRDADETFKVWRAWYLELVLGDLVEKHPDQFKDTILWNVAEGAKLTGPQIGRAEKRRTRLYHRVTAFLEDYDFLVGPVSQVPPFSVDEPYPTEIAGVAMETYIDWMKSCYYISVTGLPAISVPCGFTQDGLPVGIQIVGRHHDDLGVLQLARAFEQAAGAGTRRPPLTAP